MNLTSRPVSTSTMEWMPLGDGVSIKPLRFSGDERSLLLKVDPGTRIGRHKHAGFVHAFNLSGFRRLDNGEILGPGDYVYEPPGNEDSWECHGEEPVIIQIVMSGRLTYLSEDDQVISTTDTASLRIQYANWCLQNGIKASVVDDG